VEPQETGIDIPRQAMGAANILGPDGRGETVVRAIREPHGIVLVPEGHDGHDGSEDFFLVRAAFVGKAGDDGRRDEPAILAAALYGHALAAAFDPATLLFRGFDAAEHLFHVLLRYHRTVVRGRVQRIAGDNVFRTLHELAEKLL